MALANIETDQKDTEWLRGFLELEPDSLIRKPYKPKPKSYPKNLKKEKVNEKQNKTDHAQRKGL